MAKVRTPLLLDSALTMDECNRRLGEVADIAEFSWMSMAAWKGTKPFLMTYGKEGTFTLRKRRRWKNDLAPVFYGKLVQAGRGTRVEGYFDLKPQSRTALRIATWVGVVISCLTVPLGIASLRFTGDKAGWIAILVPPTVVVWGLLVERIGWRVGESEQRYILEFLQNELVTTPAFENVSV